MRYLVALVLLAGCGGAPTEPEPPKCQHPRAAYYVPNVKGSYTLVWHCDDPDAAGTNREWWDGEDYPSVPADSVSR